MHEVGLVEVATLRNPAACHLQWHLHFDESAGMVVGLLPALCMSLQVGLI
jgi:hypothetical protein